MNSAWSLQDPALLWLGILLPLALWWRFRRQAIAKDFAPFVFVANLPQSPRQRIRGLPLVLASAAFLLLVVAMARPQQSLRRPVAQQGIDILLALDISSSMAATDLDPARPEASRLAFAREAADRFVAARRQDRIGLMAFARDARLVCPPTVDHRSLRELLAEVQIVELGSTQDATGIGTALARAALQLADSPSPSRVVILLTDGEETVATTSASASIHPQEAAALCGEEGIRVHTIAAGPDAAAAEATLRTVADTTGGMAFTARDATALDQVYRAIEELERTRFERLPWRQVDRFVPLLVLAAVLVLLARITQQQWWRLRP